MGRMNPVARFESFIEGLMEHVFTRAAGSRLQPVEIGKRLVRAMESDQAVGVDGVLVPNVYDVYLSDEDYSSFESVLRSLSQNMEVHLAKVARQQQFRMVSRPQVSIYRDARLPAGEIRVESRRQDMVEEAAPQHTAVLPTVGGTSAPAAHRNPTLLLNGQTYAVLRSPTRLGRFPDNDIVLDDRRVSRHHAELIERGSGWLLRDVGSTNGIAINGKIVKEGPLAPGDRISLGGLEATWEQ